MVKSCINWFGGKYYLANDIIAKFPKHKVYCEVFGGAAHILLKKQPSKVDIYNDINEGLYTFFKVLREHPEILYKELWLTPCSRQEFNAARNWIDEKDNIERARKFYVRTMQAINCNGGWSHSIKTSRRDMAAVNSRFISNIYGLGGARRWHGMTYLSMRMHRINIYVWKKKESADIKIEGCQQ